MTDIPCVCLDCTNLTSVTIPDSVIEIYGSFYGCSGLTELTISEGVTKIAGSAFSRCTGLTSVTIPRSVTIIGSNLGSSVFDECSGLKEITILNPDCEIYDSKNVISNGIDKNHNPYFNGTIYGYKDSTAQAYAEKYGYNFEAIE